MSHHGLNGDQQISVSIQTPTENLVAFHANAHLSF